MKIEQIRQVIEIYRAGSINKAAQKLFTSQPCVSSSLKSLEKELHQKIFLRSHQGITLTDFGELFIKNALDLLKYADQIELSARNLTYGRPPLSFGVSVNYLLFAYAAFQNLIRRYQNSSTNFRYNQVNVSDVVTDVHNRITELGLISIPTIQKEKWMATFEVEDLKFEKIYAGRPSAMVSRRNPDYDFPGTEISMRELAGDALVVIGERLPLLDSINKTMCRMIGARSIIEVNDRTTAHEFIVKGGAFACVIRSDRAYRNIDFFEHVRTYYINDLPFEFEIGWLFRRDTRFSDVAREYMADVNALLTGSGAIG